MRYEGLEQVAIVELSRHIKPLRGPPPSCIPAVVALKHNYSAGT
jgi:hypothetical protein